jgi:hypothetical protein
MDYLYLYRVKTMMIMLRYLVLCTLACWLSVLHEASAQVFIVFPVSQPDKLEAHAGLTQTVAQGSLITLGANPAATGGTIPYSWHWNPTGGLDDSLASNPVYTANVSETFVLTVTDANLCSSLDTVSIQVMNGLPDDFPVESQPHIFPNPVSGDLLTLEWPMFFMPITLRLVNVDGKVCFETITTQATECISIKAEGISSGIYMLIAEGQAIYRMKILIP